MRGVPLYGVLIALEIAGTIEAGVGYFPALDEMVAAATGEGCWWNGRRAHVSDVTDLRRATVAFTDWRASHSMAAARRGGVSRPRPNSAPAGVTATATRGRHGRVELMLDPIMSAWDCGPFPVILREAGGYSGDWQGHATIYGDELLSTTQALLPQVLALIEENEPDRLIVVEGVPGAGKSTTAGLIDNLLTAPIGGR